MNTRATLFCLAMSTFLTACKDETTISTGPSDRGSLVDPAIRPRVVSTYPPANGVGPFRIYNPGDGRGEPHFVVVFNKLMDRDPLRNGGVRVSGFDQPVRVSATIIGGGGYSDVFSFALYDSVSSYPKLMYAVDRSYTVTLDTTLLDINGNQPVGNYSFSFVPEPEFRVLAVEPSAHATGVSTSPDITILFNSPVDTSIFRALSFTPAAGGYWVPPYDGHTVSYHLLSQLPINTEFQIAVSGNAADTLGHRLTTPFSSSFVTRGFGVAGSSPSPGYSARPDASVQVSFSAPADNATIRDNFSIQPAVPGSFRFFSNGSFSFDPTNGFQGGRFYTVTLGTGIRSLAGDSLPQPYVFSFDVDWFRVETTTPYTGQTNVGRSLPLDIYFNARLDTTSIAGTLSTIPAIQGTLTRRWETALRFTPDDSLMANQGYLVTVSPGVRSAAGDSLVGAYTFWFSTGQF